MSTKTSKKPNTKTTANAVKTMTPAVETKTEAKTATPKKESATPTIQKTLLNQFSKPSGKAIVKRLQHAQILADKFEKMTEKYDDLTQFIAGKDAENSNMKFSSESGYVFNLTNPATICKVLDLVEGEFSKYLEDAETELLNYSIH